MRLLAADHPIYTRPNKIAADSKPWLLGISSGTRDEWLHSPRDLGAAWITKDTAKHRADIFAPINAHFYAGGEVGAAVVSQ
jgi:hypothetical protein